MTIAPSGSMVTISSLSIWRTLRVCARNAGIAEARNVSSEPSPTISGHSFRAPTRSSGWSACIAPNA